MEIIFIIFILFCNFSAMTFGCIENCWADEALMSWPREQFSSHFFSPCFCYRRTPFFLSLPSSHSGLREAGSALCSRSGLIPVPETFGRFSTGAPTPGKGEEDVHSKIYFLHKLPLLAVKKKKKRGIFLLHNERAWIALVRVMQYFTPNYLRRYLFLTLIFFHFLFSRKKSVLNWNLSSVNWRCH